MKRIKLGSGDEQDVLTPARKYYKYLEKPGSCKKIKKKYNKRFRKACKTELMEMERE